MSPAQIRSRLDKALFDTLMQDPLVENVNRQIANRDKLGPLGTRRQLLATSVRISAGMAPDLKEMCQQCADQLEVNIPIELYAYNSASFNAACVKPEEGRLFVMFSSGLLDAFDRDELRFVIGHELGHYIYHHHDIPIGYILRGESKADPELALKLTSWSRYAEISADRAGAYCTQNFETVGRALFKLASGITGDTVQFHLSDFLRQVDDMKLEDELPSVSSSTQDWFLTHPFSPLRVKALQVFHQSVLAIENGCSIEEMELGVQGLMALMEPSYLDAKTDAAKAMRNFLFAGSLLIANADGNISELEIKIFEDFFGKHKYSEDYNLEKLEQELPRRAERVIKANGVAKRMQLLRDLCVMVKAEGKICSAALAKLQEIATLLETPAVFIDQILSAPDDLD